MWDNQEAEYSGAIMDTMLNAPRQAVLLAGGVAFGSTDRMSDAEARFWSRVDKSDACWMWQGPTERAGYGRVYWKGKTRYAHRVSFELSRGPIPDGLDIDHLCRNRGCVNPAHLDPVTHEENCRRSPVIMERPGVGKCGHVLDYTGPDGRRGCRKCRYEAVKRWRERMVSA